MTRRPSRYAVHLLLEGGHRHSVHFASIEAFQQWYAENLNKPDAQAFINVPIADLEGEYLVVRPRAVLAVHVEPQFTGLE
ncbi:MAG: hypothetical protein RLZZ158_1419 [Cyanobacteriota bacterium]|jgi:hypothetical protein